MQTGLLRAIRPSASRLVTKSDESVASIGGGLNIAFIGDSTTEWGFIPRFVFGGVISDAEGVVGEGVVTLYDDATLQWAAAGDAAGARTSFVYGRRYWYESGSANKGNSIFVPPELGPFASAEGTPIPIDMLAQNGMGGRDQAPYVFGQILSGQRFAMAGNQGIAGQRAEQVLLRIADSWEKDTFGRPLAIKPTHVVVLVGINDVAYISGGEAPYGVAEVKDWLDDIRDAILAQGIMPIFGNLVDGDTSPEIVALIDELNLHIAGMGVPVADYHTACNGVAGAMAGSHFTTLGAKLAGAKLAEFLVSIAGQGRSRFALGSGVSNLIENGELAGEAGSLTGMTGVVAVDSTFTGSGTCVASKVSVPGENDWQVYTVTGAATGDELLVEFDPLWEIGQRVYGGIDFEVTGDGVSNVDCVIECRNADESRIESFHALTPAANVAMGELTGILRTPTIAVPSYYDSGRFYFKAILSAGDTVVKTRNGGVRSVGRSIGAST
jgi:lysophospholipase L1-like esterase